MQPLRDKFEALEQMLLRHRRTLAQSNGVPFVRLVYEPEAETECRRYRDALRRVLARESVAVRTVTCRGVIFTHYEARGRLDRLFEVEQTEPDAVADHITRRAGPALEARVMAAVEALGEDGVIFLEDVAHLYPYLQLGPVLEACVNRIRPPMALVVFYPGELDVDGNLLFLGQRPSGYYRARDLI